MLVLFVIMAAILVGVMSANGSRSGNGLAATGNTALAQSPSRMGSATAFNTAEAGVASALQWLSSRSSPPANTTAFAPSLWGGTQAGTPARTVVAFPTPDDPNSHFSVVIYPGQENPNNILKRFLIESIGTSRGRSQILQVCVQLKSFGHYAFFNDRCSGGYWASNNRSFDGPVHFNSYGATPGILWRPGTEPLFKYDGKDAFTVATPTINWAKGNTGTGPNAMPQTEDDWKTVAVGGASTVKWGVPNAWMPTASTDQRDAALGPTTPESAAQAQTGVTIPNSAMAANGGIYIQGDVEQMTLGVNNRVNQIITVRQKDASDNPVITTVTLNAQTEQTVVTTQRVVNGAPTTTTASYAGLTNGVVYCNGNIGGQTEPKRGGLEGVIADNQVNAAGKVTHFNGLNIVTNEANNVNINGDIVHYTPRQRVNGQLVPQKDDTGEFKTRAGILGIVSNTVQALDTDSAGNPLNALEVNAAVLAFNTYEVYNYNTRPKGTFLNMGSFCIRNGARINVTDGSGEVINGLFFDRRYDNRLADTPPPYFPTTGKLYNVLSWRRVGQTLQ